MRTTKALARLCKYFAGRLCDKYHELAQIDFVLIYFQNIVDISGQGLKRTVQMAHGSGVTVPTLPWQHCFHQDSPPGMGIVLILARTLVIMIFGVANGRRFCVRLI